MGFFSFLQNSDNDLDSINELKIDGKNVDDKDHYNLHYNDDSPDEEPAPDPEPEEDTPEPEAPAAEEPA